MYTTMLRVENNIQIHKQPRTILTTQARISGGLYAVFFFFMQNRSVKFAVLFHDNILLSLLQILGHLTFND